MHTRPLLCATALFPAPGRTWLWFWDSACSVPHTLVHRMSMWASPHLQLRQRENSVLTHFCKLGTVGTPSLEDGSEGHTANSGFGSDKPWHLNGRDTSPLEVRTIPREGKGAIIQAWKRCSRRSLRLLTFLPLPRPWPRRPMSSSTLGRRATSVPPPRFPFSTKLGQQGLPVA